MEKRVGKGDRTGALLRDCALDLFELQGYEQTTVGQIAAAAGVTEMTFFRHFAAKHKVLVHDPYDPIITEAVAAQPRTLDPVVRTARGIGQAWAQLPESEHDIVRRRVRVVAQTPSLRGEMWRSTADTERLVVDQLVTDGTDPLRARIAAAAVLAALTVALLAWSQQEDTTLADAIAVALDTLERSDG